MAKKNKIEKQIKETNKQFYGFNIKIQSTTNRNSTEYSRLISSIFDKAIIVEIGGEKAMLFKSSNKTEISIGAEKHECIFGQLVRYTILDNENWYDEKTKTFVSFPTPESIHPNGYETEYYFIPSLHKFFISYSVKVSHVATKNFLLKALIRVKKDGDNITVDLIQSSGTFEQIINSKEINKLEITVSYTNDDIGSTAQEAMDNLLKEAQIGYTDIILNPDANKSLNADSTMVKGLLELAQENGSAIATVTNEGGKKAIIKTEQHPEKILIPKNENGGAISYLTNLFKKYKRAS
jgi:hypothetical protein